MHFIARRPGVGTQLRDKRDVSIGGIDAVDHEVPSAGHHHQVRDTLNDERGVRAPRKGPRTKIEELVALALPKAGGPVVRPREHESDAGALRELLGEPREPALKSVGVERCHYVEDVQESVGARGDHPYAVLLVGLRVAPPQEVVADIIEKMLEQPRRSLPARADSTRQPGLRAGVGRPRWRRVNEVVEDPLARAAGPR